MEQKNLIFTLVSMAVLIDMMMYTLIIPIMPSYAMSLGADEFTIGLIFGAFSVALLLFSIPFGIISDRIGRVPLMVTGMFLLALTNLVFAISGNVYVLVLARLVQGISGAATWSAGLALIADTFDASERGSRLGIAMSVMSIGTLSGPVIGGIIYDNFGYVASFILPSVLAMATCIAFLAIRVPPGPRGSQGSYRELIGKAPLAFVVCSAAIIAGALIFGVIEPFIPVYLYQKFSATPTLIGLMFGVMSLMNIVTAPVVGKLYDRYGGKYLLSSGLALSGFLIIIIAFAPSILVITGSFAMLGVAMSLALTPILPLLSDLFVREQMGTQGFIYGIYNTLFSIGLTVGPFMGGFLVVRFTFPVTLLGLAVVVLSTGMLVLIFINDRRDQLIGRNPT